MLSIAVDAVSRLSVRARRGRCAGATRPVVSVLMEILSSDDAALRPVRCFGWTRVNRRWEVRVMAADAQPSDGDGNNTTVGHKVQ
ncbi:hypothetical protein GCM10027088_73350 [Nocardia goodfellowii]